MGRQRRQPESRQPHAVHALQPEGTAGRRAGGGGLLTRPRLLKLIGYWATPSEPGRWLHPKVLVDPNWQPARRVALVRYLRDGVMYRHYRGFSVCRFEGGPPDLEMGSKELTDGVWAWPEGLAVYVERFAVKLPELFLAHARRRRFAIRRALNEAAVRDAKADLSFWDQWCERQQWQRQPVSGLIAASRSRREQAR